MKERGIHKHLLCKSHFSSEPAAKFVNKEAGNNISAYENDSVTLCAVVSRQRANVRWLKDGQLLNEDNIHISSEGNTHKLTINPLQLSDSGEYVCDVNTDEMYFSLLVKGKSLALLNKMRSLFPSKHSLDLNCHKFNISGIVCLHSPRQK